MKLGKLKMPSKKAGEDLSSRLFAEEGAAGEESDADFANELAGESEGEDADAPELDEMGAEMEAISDEDLLAEIKRRGLTSKINEGPAAMSGKKKKAASPFPEEPAEEDDEDMY